MLVSGEDLSLFLTFEGPEGSGKSTQTALLYEALQQQGIPTICTREPGGTTIGEQIRAILHDVKNVNMRPETEVLLYSAARAQLVGQVILPAMKRGEVVISDRYVASTLAYQGYGHGLDLKRLRVITELATGGLHPDLVICLDLDVETGLGRKLEDRQEGRGEWNRMDQLEIAFHRRVRQGYLEMAQEDQDHWLVIDATQPIGGIHSMVRQRVAMLLDQSPGAAPDHRGSGWKGGSDPWTGS